MPLIAWAVLLYATALHLTLSLGVGFGAALGGAALVLSALLVRQRGPFAALSTVIATGALVAGATLRTEARCGAVIAAASTWSAELEVDITPDKPARLSISAGNCTSRATVLLDDGRARGGSRVEVQGTVSHGTRGVLIRDASVVRRGSAGSLVQLRARAGRRIDRIFGSDAPMVRALVIGDMSGIAVSEREAFAGAGLVHMLSVSGLHVGIIAVALELLAQLLRAPRVPASVATLALLAAYVATIGAPPPAVRAALMLGALVVSRLAQRPVSPWAVLALGAGAPLVHSRVVTDLGWQLSVVGAAALIAGGRLAQRLVSREWSRWRRAIATGGIVSIVATVATAPLVAWTYGRVALLGPVTNLLADPVMAVLQPLLFLGMAVPVPAIESLSADAAHVLLALFARIAHVAAAIPGAAPPMSPTVVGAVAAAVVSVALLVACCTEHSGRALRVMGAAVGVIALEPLVPHRRAPELHMLDVGQGDALALRTGRGRWIVVDAGRTWEGGDAGRSILAPYLAHRGGEIALFVLSHPHADHVGGAASLFLLRRPDRFLDPAYVGVTPSYRAALAAAQRQGVPWQRVRPGDSIVVDDIVLTALAPDSAWTAGLRDANLASTVMMARLGAVRVLLTGDAELEEEDWLVDRYGATGALRADVLKVAHHGSRTSSSPRFLAAVQPRLALISVGAHNAYGHPSPTVLHALASARVTALRTDRLGTVVLRAMGSKVEVRAAEQTWMLSGP